METENTKPNNPQAFPIAETRETQSVELGMTLRDYFANSADVSKQMRDMTKEQCEILMGYPYPTDNIEHQMMYSLELESKLQFMKADAMLKQREL